MGAVDSRECKQLVLSQFFAHMKTEESPVINEGYCKAKGSSRLIYKDVDVTLKVAFEQVGSFLTFFSSSNYQYIV